MGHGMMSAFHSHLLVQCFILAEENFFVSEYTWSLEWPEKIFKCPRGSGQGLKAEIHVGFFLLFFFFF